MGRGGGAGDFLHMTTDGKKNPTRSVNRKKNNVTQGKSRGCTCPKKNSAPPQKFNGPLLSNVNNNSDGNLSGTFLASVADSIIQWHMPKMRPYLITTNA